MKNHPELKPYIVRAGQDIMENRLKGSWYSKMKTLISNLAKAKKPTSDPPSEAETNELFRVFFENVDIKETALVVTTSPSPREMDKIIEQGEKIKEVSWRM